MTTIDPLPDLLVEPAVRAALLEDLGRAGDLTTDAVIPTDARMRGTIRARRAGTIAGVACARIAFALMDPAIRVDAVSGDGTRARPGDVVMRIEGRARPILTAERVALNFLCRLSGIATATAALVDAVLIDVQGNIQSVRARTVRGLVLNDAEIRQVIEAGHMREFANKQLVYKKDADSNALFVILKGRIRIMSAEGAVIADQLDPQRYFEFIGEAVQPASYLKSPYYLPLGFPDGMYRVGPLARPDLPRDGVEPRRGGEALARLADHVAQPVHACGDRVADGARARRRADEPRAEVGMVLGDTVETPEKIEVPPRTAQLSVRDAAQSERLLLRDDALDLAILDGPQASGVERAFGMAPPRVFERRRAQQAAHVVGTKRRRRILGHRRSRWSSVG